MNVCKFHGRLGTSGFFQEYKTTCLLGCETDTYDSEGSRVRLAPWRHVTRQSVDADLPKFTGQIQQVPPMFVNIIDLGDLERLCSNISVQIFCTENGWYAFI